jgi:TP901 family phage tail tape measure protein
MANALTYILSLDDRMSGKLKAIGIGSDAALNKFAGLQRQAVTVSSNLSTMGRSVSTLNDKLNLMRAERDLIPASNIKDIRTYNSEIQKLEKQIGKLQTTNNGSKLKSLTKDAISSLPGGDFITNPVVAATAAVGFMTKQALDFDEGMAKINITAQLSKDKLDALKGNILQVGKNLKVDPAQLTPTFEKILSQVNDVDVSMKIFESTLKGSKAGFTDASIVADALAQSVSAIGAKNADAQQVLDVLFAAKRVGAGEFRDYATYVPGLIADARNLGIAFQDTAGIFAFMTAKGNSAERSAMLMQNAFTALGKGEIQKGLAGAGVNVFDKAGNIRAIDEIMVDLSAKMKSLGSDEARSNFLEKIGLKDAQAKSAFSVLISDTDKLKESLNATRNASGETDAALKFAMNSAQTLTDVWNVLKTSLTQAGGGFVELLKPVLSLGGFIMTILGPVLEGLGKTLGWIVNGLQEGNPVVYGMAAAMLTWAVATNAAAWGAGIASAATAIWTGAQWLLNAAFIASPLGWVVLAVGALVGATVWAWKTFEGFRGAIYGLWDAFKQVFTNIGDFFKRIFSPIFEAITAFKEGRWGDAAKAVGQMALNLTPVGMITQTVAFAAEGGFTKGVTDAFKSGAAKATSGDAPSADQGKAPLATPEATNQPAINFNPGINVIAPGSASENMPAWAAPQGQDQVVPVIPQGNTKDTTSTSTKESGKTAEAIATGGQKTQNFNISIGKIIEKFTVENSSGMAVEDIEEKVLDGIMRALNMSQSLANG